MAIHTSVHTSVQRVAAHVDSHTQRHNDHDTMLIAHACTHVYTHVCVQEHVPCLDKALCLHQYSKRQTILLHQEHDTRPICNPPQIDSLSASRFDVSGPLAARVQAFRSAFVRWFVGSFVRWFVGSLVCLFVREKIVSFGHTCCLNMPAGGQFYCNYEPDSGWIRSRKYGVWRWTSLCVCARRRAPTAQGYRRTLTLPVRDGASSISWHDWIEGRALRRGSLPGIRRHLPWLDCRLVSVASSGTIR